MNISVDFALLLSAAGRAAGPAAGCAAAGTGGTKLGSARRRFATGATLLLGTSASSFARRPMLCFKNSKMKAASLYLIHLPVCLINFI
jgi:hypothetical protein